MILSQGGAMERRDLLLTVSEELRDLGAATASLQATLVDILEGAAGGGGGPGLWHVQEIDRLQQTLEDLSAILRRAAEHDGELVDVDHLIEVTRLGALRDRLRRTAGDAIGGQQPGAVALF